MQKKRAVKEIDANDPERFLLRRSVFIEHPHVHDDLARFIARMRLELYPHPAVAFGAPFERPRHHRVAKSEKGSLTARVAQSFEIELELQVEHRLQPFPRNIALRAPVNR